ncbi:MAG: ATP-binding protein [Anaerolineales bacterium]
MSQIPAYKEPLSQPLRRQPQGSKGEVASAMRWVGFSALGIFLALTISYLLLRRYDNALATSLGVTPIIISLLLIQRNKTVTLPSIMLAVTLILLITVLATLNQGIYDIGVLGFPVILIVAGLILRGKVVMYLAFLIIVCMGWLVFGDLWHLYKPVYLTVAGVDDFFIGSIIILVAGNTVYRLVKNVYHNLQVAEQEIRMREEAEREREAIIQQLQRKNEELDRFAVRVSHDLKTPLITLAGFLGYLDKDIKAGNKERAEKDFAQINEAARSMGSFVDELLDLSRVGRIINQPKDVAFDEIIQDALKATEGLLQARGVQVEVEAAFPYVYVDRARIVQVMQNLLTNAVKFMGDQPAPRIVISFEEIDGEHIFSVRDNGIGIAPEHHERIFELFHKLDPNSDGTGIGLGLVKKIIELHRGKIWVQSEPGKGATFFFTLGESTIQEKL